jgi:diacylglycerol kinase family enzyme
VRSIDVGALQVTGSDGSPVHRVFANTASFGMSSRIAADVAGSAKRLGGSLSYWIGTARALLSQRASPVSIRLDDEERRGLVNTVAIGNGRYVGGGMKIAPHALLDDGMLDVVCIDDVGVFEFVRHSRRLYAGTHVELPFVRVARVRRVEAVALDASGGAGVLADVEGEPIGNLPLACEVREAALRVLAPWSDAEAVRRDAPPGGGDRV